MRSLLRFTGVVVVLAVSSCGTDLTAPEPGPPPDVAGEWTFAELLTNARGQIQCNDYGTLTISRSDANLSGTVDQHGGCDVPGGTIDNSGTGPLTGDVGATTIRLTFGRCDYHGDLFHTPIDSADGTVTCTERVGTSLVTLSGIWSANFQVPSPTVAGTITIPPGDVLAVTGERVRITFAAKDEHGLRWVGYSLTPPASVQDSFAVLDTTYADTIYVTVPASWQGTSNLDVWARNAYKKFSFTDVAQLSVLDAVRHPSQTVALGVRAGDAAYDPARNVMYFTEPDSARVAVLSLNTFTFGSPIPLPMVKRGLGFQSVDIVPGGDTAIVALPDTLVSRPRCGDRPIIPRSLYSARALRRAATCTTRRRTRFRPVAHSASTRRHPRPRRRMATSGSSAVAWSMARSISWRPWGTVVPACHLTDRSRMSRRGTATIRSRCPRAHCSNACASPCRAPLPRSE